VHKFWIKAVALAVAAGHFSSVIAAPVQRDVVLPEGTRIYLELLERVSGKRGEANEGDVVRSRVWRDVTVDGVTIISAGTMAHVRVDNVKHARMFGMKGELSLGAVETKTTDGQVVTLTGGYNKEGKSYAAVTTTVTLLLFWPAMFVFGKAAHLPTGTVFDAFTLNAMKMRVEGAEAAPVVNLAAVFEPGLSAEFVMDNLRGEKPPDNFQIRVIGPRDIPTTLVIDSVNGKPIEPLGLEVVGNTPMDERLELLTEVSVKKLAKHFQKGINRVEVAYNVDGKKESAEAILNAQF